MTERRPRTEAEITELVRSIEVRAPESLHRDVHALIARRARRAAPGAPAHRQRLAGVGAAAMGLVAALVVALALVVGGGSSSSAVSVRAAAALTLRAPTLAAPAESAQHSMQLAVAVDGVAFPYWEELLGWRSTGARIDRLGGRAVTTVFYTDGSGHRVGYAIVSGTPAPRASGGTVSWRTGTPYRLLRENGVLAVTWLRQGRLCVVSGRGVSGGTLLRLASWDERGGQLS